MRPFSFFNIGYRSAIACRELDKYNKNQDYNTGLIEDSAKIISDGLDLNNETTNMLSKDIGYNYTDLLDFIFDYFTGKNIKEIIDNLNKIQNILTSVKDKKNGIDVSNAINFFKRLSDYCLIQNRS